VGTRFIASEEAELSEDYKKAVLAAGSDETLRAPFMNDLVPPPSDGAYATAPRVVRNSFVEEWHGREDEVRRMQGQLSERLRAAIGDGTLHELLVISGEVAGAINEILPAAEIVRRMASEAEDALHAATQG
jgi:nitronate monooxygenase/enoyl-[acyl-carrier protein] reductase II